MITTGLDTRVNVQQLLESQLPEFLLTESPNTLEFFKSYYASQEHQGGSIDIVDNFDQYLKVDNLTPERLNTGTILSVGIGTADTTINVASTKGFPKTYGLFKINDEIITYTGITTNSFTGCVRGFSGISSYHAENNPGELVFSTSDAASALTDTTVVNLSSLFLKEFYKKQKFTLTPGLEDTPFVSNVNAGTFIKEAKSLYQSKGTEESFRILFNVLYGVNPKIVDLEGFLIKPSSAEFIRREILVTERIIGDPNKLVGQTITLSTDSDTKGAVSSVEVLTTKGGRVYYKVSLFVGFNEKELIKGTFKIAGATKNIGAVGIGSTVVTVDSTVGFTTVGKFISGINTVSYLDKSFNQFFGCSGITSSIRTASNIRSDEVAFGYENGDLSKKVELRITGVLSDFASTSDIILTSEGEQIGIRNLGEKILNPDTKKTSAEIFANSWIYNTSSRFEIDDPYTNANKSTPVIPATVDRSQLKKGDNVEILVRGNREGTATGIVTAISADKKNVTLSQLTSGFVPATNEYYDLRRTLNTASAGITPLEVENNRLTSDIQNVYINDENTHFYVASNSLPSYSVDLSISKAGVSTANSNPIQEFSNKTNKYSVIAFANDVPFITGDEVRYISTTGIPIPGLLSGTKYFVRVLTDTLGNTNRIQLYTSQSFIVTNDYEEFDEIPFHSGSHNFTLERHSDERIGSQKLLKKFPVNSNIMSGDGIKTLPGSIGMLSNGVEVSSYKSYDKIYFGPLSKITLFKPGQNYDIINPPTITISKPGIGTLTALVQPVITGDIKEIQVDQQNFDIDIVRSITVKGGNGSGAVLQPIVTQRFREISFDARIKSNALVGGVDMAEENIVFNTTHNLDNGLKLVYDSDGNPPLGINVFKGSNLAATGVNTCLQNGAIYWTSVVGTGNSIKLYPSEPDYVSGINTVGFTTINASGTHKFRLYEGRNHLRSVKVLNPGTGYSNRKLRVDTYVGINTVEDSIEYENHGFDSGELITYAVEASRADPLGGVVATGLSTSLQYKVIKIDDNKFRLSNAGIGGTISSNYTRGEYVDIQSKGAGYHIFAYPPIELEVDAKYAKVAIALTESIVVTPVARGSIEQVYAYEKGAGYGSTILNFEKTPLISIKTGKLAELKPIVSGGKIYHVDIQNQGEEYNAPPDLTVEGDGYGAEIRAVVEDGKIIDVKVLNPGTGYTQLKTTVRLDSPGKFGELYSNVRNLTVNNYRFAEQHDTVDKAALLSDSKNNLNYSFVGYSTDHGNTQFGDDGTGHSPIIGWAYDGNPIYGPYGHSDPMDNNSSIIILTPSYVQQTITSGIISDRPVGFGSGFFTEDFVYDGSGDLDISNGRYCKTPEYPNGTYAYFVGVSTNPISGKLEPKFPYFIGDVYRSNPLEENLLAQDQYTFDFKNIKIARNTFPYKVSDAFADNDFLVESNELVDQISVIESITKGIVDSFQVLQAGSGYKVGESAKFDNTGTNGGGITASIKSITGKDIFDVNTKVEKYQNVVFKWTSPNEVSGYISTSHSFTHGDEITISGLSTSIGPLTRNHKIGISSARAVLKQNLGLSVFGGGTGTVGVSTDILVSVIPEGVSVGSSISIGSEILKVIDVFDDWNVLRATRGRRDSTVGIGTTGDAFELVPSFFTIPVKSRQFNSKINDIVYFNASRSIGVGTQVGVATVVNNKRGLRDNVPISITSQSIHIPNHPFTQNQKVSLTIPAGANALSISTVPGNVSPVTLGASGSSLDVFVINKSKDFIGITTQLGICTSGMFFHTSGSNSDLYSLESNYSQVTGRVEKITSTVSISTITAALSTSHGMKNGDVIGFTLKPNQTVGIGTSTAVRVKYHEKFKNLLVNTITINGGTDVNTTTNTINIDLHDFTTGQKIFYDGGANTPSGLTTGSYYVYRVDDDNIRLGKTRYDVVSDPPIIVGIGTTGGSQEISLINPPIPVVNNNNLKFDLSDSSLSGYKFKLFYDSDLKNEFVSTGQTSVSVTSGVGTVGVSTDASFTLKHSTDNPNLLYYSIGKSGFISTSDTDVKNSSEIYYTDSKYNGEYTISGVGNTTFNLALRSVPESPFCSPATAEILEYTTDSATAVGGISSMRLEFGGTGYKRLPKFVGITSTNGKDGNILPQSTEANRIGEVRIIDPGFEYPSDPTLRPDALISPIITIKDSSTIANIEVVSGGNNYLSAPDLIVVDPETNIPVDNGFVYAEVSSASVSDVHIVDPPRGLKSLEQRIVSLNNSNGVSIETLEYSAGNNRVTLTLSTPTLGFKSAPFAEGDKIFVEGLEKFGTSGEGFNSTDHGYKFFTVNSNTDGSALGSNPVKVAFSLNGFTTNPGSAKTDQSGYASLVKEAYYPTFKTTQTLAAFRVGEKLSVFRNGKFISTGLLISDSKFTSIKVFGKYRLELNDRIKGETTGTIGTINTLDRNKGQFVIDYSLRKDEGWNDAIGKLSEDHQVLPDNDYYQNLSYAVNSTLEYEDLASPVNRLLHPSGLKNFANVGIASTTPAGVSKVNNATVISQDLVSEERVDTVNIVDHTRDIDVQGSKSRFLQFQNKKLSSYILCDTNRVIEIDDISSEFSKATDVSINTNIIEIDPDYSQFLIQVRDIGNDNTQLTELTVFRDDTDIFTLERGNLYNTTNELIAISGKVQDNDSVLSFIPADTTADYDIKIYTSKFNTAVAGINTQAVGFMDLVGVTTTVGIGTSTNIISVRKDELDAYKANFEITDAITDEKTIVDLYLTHDDTLTYSAEAYTDSHSQGSFSSNFIGTFHSNITNGILSLNYENTSPNAVSIRSRIVGFGTTSVGVGTQRWKDTTQLDGTERSMKMESSFVNIGVSTGGTAFDDETPGAYVGDSPAGISSTIVTAFKSNIRVSIGETSAIHQLLTIWDGTDAHTTNYPFVSIGTTTGIGTFKSSVTDAIRLQFIPDAQWNGQSIDIQRLDEIIYSESDVSNDAPNLTYGPITESIDLLAYNGSGNRLNKTAFVLKHDGVPIFEKIFNPTLSTIVNLTTGRFTITDHFFNTGEELIYTPKSSFTGIAGTAMQMANGSVLPTSVFAIRDTKDTFRLATSEANAEAGTAITFMARGGGNIHELEMVKKMEKSIIQVDGIIQSPIAFSPLTTTLSDNISNVSISTDTFSVAGLSSISPKDLFKINDEFVKVTQVGVGTTSTGPITGIGTFNLVTVDRGVVGTSTATHNNGATVRYFPGSFNIIGSKIHFSEPPHGSATSLKNQSNLDFVKSSFNGRVYFRQDYTDNRIFDDVSHDFTGIGQTFRMSLSGVNTTGINTGSTIVLLNGMFQTPTTANNEENNYIFAQSGAGHTGITSAIFTGINTVNPDGSPGVKVQDLVDANKNQLPRGGMLVSLGSSGGMGISPLEGAVLRPVTANKAITGFVGVATWGSTLSISTASYENTSGELRITTNEEHYLRMPNEFVNLSGLAFTCSGSYDVTDADYAHATGYLTLTIGSHILKVGEKVKIANNSLQFTCDKDNHGSNHTYPRAGTDPVAGIATPITSTTANTVTIRVGVGTTSTHIYNGGTASDALSFGSEYVGVTTTIFPDADNDKPFSVVAVHSPFEFTAKVGISTIRHIYRFSGIASAYYAGLNWGSGYTGIPGIASVSVYDEEYEHKFVSASSTSITIRPEGIGGITTFSPSFISYASTTGDLILHKTGIGGTTGISTVLTFDRHNATTGTAYNATTGILTVRLSANPSPALVNGQLVSIDDDSLTFTCAEDSHATNHTYPRYTDPASKRWYQISNVNSNIQFEIKVLDKTPSTNATDHRFVSAVNKAIKRSKNTVGIATNSITMTCDRDNHKTKHTYPRTTDPVAGLATAIIGATENSITVNVRPGGGAGTGANIVGVTTHNTHRYNGGTATNAIFQNTWGNNAKNVTNATYTPSTGQLVLTSASHGYSASNTIGIDTGKIVFTCARDNFSSDHGYPRAGYAHSFSASASTLTNAIVSGGAWSGTGHNVSDASYNPTTGLLVLTSNAHGLTTSDTVGIRTASLAFKCSRDQFATDHTYPRAGFEHTFVSAVPGAIIPNAGIALTPTAAKYDGSTGLLELTFSPAHNLTTSNTVGIATNGIVFTCEKDNHTTEHSYPRTTDPIHTPSWNAAVAIAATTTNTITVNVGRSNQTDPITGITTVGIAETTTNTITIQVGRSLTGADPMSGISTIPIDSVTTDTITLNVGAAPNVTGGSLLFNVTAAGSGYVNPKIAVSPPSYANLETVGVSRLGVGATTEIGTGGLITVDVGAGSSVGIGSTLVGLSQFKIARSGYGYEVGDVFSPVGLVTDYRIPKLISDLELTVTEIFTDRFSSWDFGEFDYIDDIASLQNGTRTRFPLYYNGSLLSFEKDPNGEQSTLIEMENLLLIFINNVLQDPGYSYRFNGGTSVEFTDPPTADQKVSIFFYRGTVGDDSKLITIRQSLKKGDVLQIRKDNTLTSEPTQNSRTLVGIVTSDTIETDIYSQQGIDINKFKPTSWSRQKVDKVINGEIVYKNRDLYEPLVYPTARIIGDVATNSGTIHVDNADFFTSDDVTGTPDIDALMVSSLPVVAAAVTAVVSAAGTISSLSIVSGGSGYVGSSTSIVIGIPTTGIKVGVGTTATATATISGGAISAIDIVNPGLGYTRRNPPQAIAPNPAKTHELVQTITAVEGFSGIVTGISTTNPTSTKLAIEFYLSKTGASWGNLGVGTPVYIYDTAIGSGSTSLWNNNNNNVVGIGTTFLDNVYRISQFSSNSTTGVMTCFVHTGLTTTTLGNRGDRAPGIITGRDANLGGVGKFSWGKVSSLTRSETPISIGVTGHTVGLTTQLGISTFPTLQRRGYGLYDSGALEI